MTKALRRRRDPAAPDDGAAAVEFALLLPIFVILAVGMMSAGILFFNNLTVTQASRDAARLGTTLPITTATPVPSGEVDITTWLQRVHDVAKTQVWGSPSTDITTESNGVGYICVADVRQLTGTGMNTTSMYSGVARGYNTNSTQKCFEDSRDDNRVQVLVRRDGELNGVFFYKKWELVSKGDIPYERQAP
jgi:Flp pilus assembly protein TadG